MPLSPRHPAAFGCRRESSGRELTSLGNSKQGKERVTVMHTRRVAWLIEELERREFILLAELARAFKVCVCVWFELGWGVAAAAKEAGRCPRLCCGLGRSSGKPGQGMWGVGHYLCAVVMSIIRAQQWPSAAGLYAGSPG